MIQTETKKNDKKIIIAICVPLLVIVFALALYLINKPKINPPDVNLTQNSTKNETSNSDSSSGQMQETDTNSKDNTTVSPADTFYQNALSKSANKEYNAAISEIDKAILLNQNNDLYWSKKASFYALKNDIVMEKKTLEQGLEIIPNSDLLQSQLDIVNRDWTNTDDASKE